MATKFQFRVQTKPNTLNIVLGCAIIVAVVSLSVLTSWLLDISALKTVLPGFPEMKPNAAIAMLIAAAGLFCISRKSDGNSWGRAAVACGVLVFLIGSLTLGEFMTGSDIGIDNLLISATAATSGNPFPGRMSPHSAFNFVLLGISFTTLIGGRRFQKISEFVAIILSITTVASVIGYLYGAQQLYGVSQYIGMAVHTAGLFIICSCALLIANPHSEMGKLVISPSLGGVAARRLVPAVVLIPLAIDWLRIRGEENGIFDSRFGSALMQFSRIIIMGWFVLIFSKAAHKMDFRRKALESELAENEQRYRDLFDYSEGMICIHDLEGTIKTVNPATVRSIGYELQEIVGHNLIEFLPEKDRSYFPVFLRKIENDGIADGLFPLVSKNGKQVIWRYHSILISEPGAEPYVIGHAQDVTDLMAAQKQLKNLTLTDDLTGLYNRRGFTAMAEQQIKLERHQRTARGLTLMFADIDGLKQINDKYGHDAGSDAIIQLSKALSASLRSADLVGRWGGDEFVILTIGSQDEDASIMFDRIHNKIEEYNASSGKPYQLACSVGLAPVPIDGKSSLEDVLAQADQAMYAEKLRRKAERADNLRLSGIPSAAKVIAETDGSAN